MTHVAIPTEFFCRPLTRQNVCHFTVKENPDANPRGCLVCTRLSCHCSFNSAEGTIPAAHSSIKGPPGAAAAKQMTLPFLFLGPHGHGPFANEEKRIEPVDMHYGGRVSDQITYRLPEGETTEGGPQSSNSSWTGHALFVVKITTSPGQIVVSDTLARAFTFAKTDEYQDLRGFYQKIAAVDQEQLVLSGGAEQKGN
jgi:hypothetical protein